MALLLAGCASAPASIDAGLDAASRDATIAVQLDAAPRDAAEAPTDAPPPDAGPETLAAMRDRLFATLGDDECERWSSMDESRRAVFLTITHRLFTSITPDGLPMLAHVERVYLVLGGGDDGTSSGGAENNRLFLSTDAYLHDRMVETWNDTNVIDDGAGATWIHTRDIAGPHDPFDASIETDTGLRCVLFFETSDSRPPTAQAHFFEGAPEPVRRGDEIDLPADPHMMEIDLDFNCVHDSNPTCGDFYERYVTSNGEFECEWAPSGCGSVATGSGG
ncbi:Hypothetical protein I5071_88080 [Sandaracinus amylolyticus]|nr:Hypothetical protein I5071_88080 [Sandaracinus amylolyticus]